MLKRRKKKWTIRYRGFSKNPLHISGRPNQEEMVKLSKRTCSCLIFTNLWTFPAYHMDASKEKYYGNTCTWPKHFREPNLEEVKIFFVPSPHAIRRILVFHFVLEGQGGDAGIISAFS